MRRYIIGITALLIVGGLGIGGYVVLAQRRDDAARQARIELRTERIDRAYRVDLKTWRSDLADWTAKDTAYKACDKATRSAFGAADGVRARVRTGGSYDEYTSAAEYLTTELGAAAREADGVDCLTIIDTMQTISEKVTDGTNIWHDWLANDKYSWATSVDDLPEMDTHFAAAVNSLDDAELALRDMRPGDAPLKPVRGHPYQGDVES